jgi:hypothetical protein
MAYVTREIDITVTLGTGTLGDGQGNSVKLTGLRVECTIVKAGGLSFNTADIRVYGMPLHLMNQLSTLGQVYMAVRNNTVKIEAGDAGSVKAVVFFGVITDGFVDFAGQPDVCFHIVSRTALTAAVKAVPPTSYPGPVDAVTVLQSLATLGGFTFQNNGVSGVRLPACYFPGTVTDQIRACVEEAGINSTIDDASVGNVLVIWPRGGVRNGTVPLISPDTGMIGYPTFNSMGVAVRTLYQPGLSFGALFQITSSITPANGQWQVFSLIYELSSQAPGGPWMCLIEAARRGIDVYPS